MGRWRYRSFAEAHAAARAETPGSEPIVPAVALVHCLERAAVAAAEPDADDQDRALLVEVRARIVTRLVRALRAVPDETLPQADAEIEREDDGGSGGALRRRAMRMTAAYIRLSRAHWSPERRRRFDDDTFFVRDAKNRVVKDREGRPRLNKGKHEVDLGPFGELRARLVHLVHHDLETRG